MLEANGRPQINHLSLDMMAYLSTQIENDKDFVSYISMFKKLYTHDTVQRERSRRMKVCVIEKRKKIHLQLQEMQLGFTNRFYERAKRLFLYITNRFAQTEYVGSDELYALVNKLDKLLNLGEFRAIPAENIAAEGEQNLPANKWDFELAAILNDIAAQRCEFEQIAFLRKFINIFKLDIREVEKINNSADVFNQLSIDAHFRGSAKYVRFRLLSLCGSGMAEFILGLLTIVKSVEGVNTPLIVLLSINSAVLAASASAQFEASTGYLSRALGFFRQRFAGENSASTLESTQLLPEDETSGSDNSYQGVFVEESFGPNSNLPDSFAKRLGA